MIKPLDCTFLSERVLRLYGAEFKREADKFRVHRDDRIQSAALQQTVVIPARQTEIRNNMNKNTLDLSGERLSPISGSVLVSGKRSLELKN